MSLRDTWLMKSDEKLVPERYWILKAGQLHYSLVWYIGSKYGVHKQIFGDLSEEGASVVLVRLSANWYNVQPFKISAALQLVEWRMLLSGKIFPGGRKYLRLRLRSMPGCLCSHQIPIQTFTPICNAASPALFSYLSWEGGVPVEKNSVQM